MKTLTKTLEWKNVLLVIQFISIYFKLIEVQCNVLFLSAFGIELDSKMREKESLEYGRMHIFWALKPKSFQDPWMGPGPQPNIAHFTHMTLLRYIGKFQPRKLPPAKSWIRTWIRFVQQRFSPSGRPSNLDCWTILAPFWISCFRQNRGGPGFT